LFGEPRQEPNNCQVEQIYHFLKVGRKRLLKNNIMYILTFKRSKSKHFQKALNHAINMGASWDGETAKLIIPEKDLLTAYEDIHFLFGYIQKWNSTKATFRGKPVHPYRFIFQVWNTVNKCRTGKSESEDPRYCWSACDSKGWGCKQLQRILRYARGTPHYKTSNRYWYNFGEYIDHDTWKLNKPLILQRLKKEVEDKALFLCPFFRMEEIEKAVRSLPNIIKVDNKQFTKYFTAEYVGGIKKAVPVNIRHVVPKKQISSMQDIINQDPGQYQWN